MSTIARASALAPFEVRSFRFQWPADLTASWAFEMETIILGWYVLVETRSVLLLTLFASLQWIGTLVAPMFGLVGDRIGHRNLLCAMRVFYTLQATILMILALTGTLSPLYVFVISAAMSMVRPSDLVMRYALVGETMPAAHLMGAMSIERTTSDSARVVGALAGAGLIAALGMGAAYVVITAFYAFSLLLSFGIAGNPRKRAETAHVPSSISSPWRDLSNAFAYVRRTPLLLAVMSLAFVVNLSAYPMTLGLLPYVAKEIYHTDQTGLGYLAASFAFGALLGSLGLSRHGSSIRAGRWTVIFAALWYAMLVAFALTHSLIGGIVTLLLVGCAQSLSLVPMSAILLRHSEERYRGRVVGIRMFAIYGLAIGLLVAGPLIARFGFAAMAMLYCLIGLAATALITLRWRGELWRSDAPANVR